MGDDGGTNMEMYEMKIGNEMVLLPFKTKVKRNTLLCNQKPDVESVVIDNTSEMTGAGFSNSTKQLIIPFFVACKATNDAVHALTI